MLGTRGTRAVRIFVLMVSLALTGAAYAGSSPPPTPPGTDSAAANIGSTDSPSAGAMVFDLLLVRPVSLAATAIGTALFVVNLPLCIFEENAPAQPFQKLVVDPLHYTFKRPLGQMN